jgi:hypothetical protein
LAAKEAFDTCDDETRKSTHHPRTARVLCPYCSQTMDGFLDWVAARLKEALG